MKLFGVVKKPWQHKDVERCWEVKIHDIYFDLSNSELLIEYQLNVGLEEASAKIKITYPRNPTVTLSKYYEHKRGLR